MTEIGSSPNPNVNGLAGAQKQKEAKEESQVSRVLTNVTSGKVEEGVNLFEHSTSSYASSVTNLIENANPEVGRDRLGAFLSRSSEGGKLTGHRIGHWVKESKKEGKNISFRVRGPESGSKSSNKGSISEILSGNVVFDPSTGEYVDTLELIRRSDPELAEKIENGLFGVEYKYDPHQAEMDLISAITAISSPINALQGLKNLGLESPEAKAYLASVISDYQGKAKDELDQLVRLGKNDLAKAYADTFQTVMRDIADSNTGGSINRSQVNGEQGIAMLNIGPQTPVEIEVIETDVDGVEHVVDVYTAPAEECYVCVELNNKLDNDIRNSVDSGFVEDTVSNIRKQADEDIKEKQLAKEEIADISDTAHKVLAQRNALSQIQNELLALKEQPTSDKAKVSRRRAVEIERQITGEKVRPTAQDLDRLV